MAASDRTPEQVARDHLAAVESGDPAAMAVDYAEDAVLERPDATFAGKVAIEQYFTTVPERLGEASVVFDELVVNGPRAVFRWHLEPTATPVSGRDECRIEHGYIVHQRVTLDRDDF
jgi:ketosteroid isomerase-like protein